MIALYIFLSALAILLIANIILTLKAGKKNSGNEIAEIKTSVGALIQNLKDTEANLKSEFSTNRKEHADSSKALREEVGNQLNEFTKTFSAQLSALTKSVEEKFTSFQASIDNNNKDSRKELKDNLEAFKNDLNLALKDFKDNLRNNFADFNEQQRTQNVASSEKLDGI
jgi:DNA recombination protein RmuC